MTTIASGGFVRWQRGVHAVTTWCPGARRQPQAGGQFFGEDLRCIVSEHD
jgi:hypothetical protein